MVKRLLIVLLLASPAIAGNSYHVTTTGGGAGQNGSLAQPWRLSYAVNSDSCATPAAGDTIWVHAGTHSTVNGQFIFKLNGTAGNPIVVRNYQNERAIILADSFGIAAIKTSSCSYMWIWGLEIKGSPVSPRTTGVTLGDGLDLNSDTNCKYINLIIHDVNLGIGWWTGSVSSEIYGCIFYACGFNDAGSNHIIYGQNDTLNPRKYLRQSLLTYGYRYGLHLYGTGEEVDSMTVDSCCLINYEGYGNIWGRSSASAPRTLGSVAIGNHWFWAKRNDVGSRYFSLYYNNGSYGQIIQNNWMARDQGVVAFGIVPKDTLSIITGNRVYGDGGGVSGMEATYSDNYWMPGAFPSTGDTTFVFKNGYEPTRANLIVYNWDRGDSVRFSVSGTFSSGDTITVRNAFDYYTNTYVGVVTNDSLTIPMDSTRWQPTGYENGLSADFWISPYPEYGVFVASKSSETPSAEAKTYKKKLPRRHL